MKTNLIIEFESDSSKSLQKMYGDYLGLSFKDLTSESLDKFLCDFSSKYTAGDTDDGEDNRLKIEVDNLDDLCRALTIFKDVKQTVFLDQRTEEVKVSYAIMNRRKINSTNSGWNASLSVSVDLKKAGVELQGRIDSAVAILKGHRKAGE